MSEASQAAFVGISKARARLQLLADGLGRAASGEVRDAAAAEVQARIDKVQTTFLARHVRSGNARDEGKVTSAGGLIQAVRTDYTRFIPGDPFRRGAFPPFILKQAMLIYSRALLAALRGGSLRHGEEGIAAEVVADAGARAAKAAARKASRKAAKS